MNVIGNSIEKRSKNFAIRCTPKMEIRMKNKAKQLGMSTSEFVNNCIEAGLARRTKYDRYHVVALVQAQEALNHIIMELGSGQENIKKTLVDFSREEFMKLWES